MLLLLSTAAAVPSFLLAGTPPPRDTNIRGILPGVLKYYIPGIDYTWRLLQPPQM